MTDYRLTPHRPNPEPFFTSAPIGGVPERQEAGANAMHALLNILHVDLRINNRTKSVTSPIKVLGGKQVFVSSSREQRYDPAVIGDSFARRYLDIDDDSLPTSDVVREVFRHAIHNRYWRIEWDRNIDCSDDRVVLWIYGDHQMAISWFTMLRLNGDLDE